MARHRALAAALARMTDDELRALGGDATASIGGATAVAAIEDMPVFIKRVPLTDRERAHPRSTANLFGLPMFYQYGIGSVGFGAWRELAALERTTAWVEAGEATCFPLLHHARVIAGAANRPFDAPFTEFPPIAARLAALRDASATLILVLEHVPHTVASWLAREPAAIAMVERELGDAVAFMGARDLLHFDAHFRNVLTDGARVYVADFGLAMASWFDLAADERAFFERNRTHDERYLSMTLVNWLAQHDPGRRDIIDRHAAIAAEMAAFYEVLQRDPAAQ